jgi:hypothetical protein
MSQLAPGAKPDEEHQAGLLAHVSRWLG